MVYLWRAVDAEGEVLDVLVQSKRNKHAALKLVRKVLRKHALVPEQLVTDELRSYSAAVRSFGSNASMSSGDGRTIEPRIRICRRGGRNARCSGSRAHAAQRFLSTHADVYNTFNVHRHLTSAQMQRAFRAAAMDTWRTVIVAA
jgi:putative transposase